MATTKICSRIQVWLAVIARKQKHRLIGSALALEHRPDCAQCRDRTHSSSVSSMVTLTGRPLLQTQSQCLSVDVCKAKSPSATIFLKIPLLAEYSSRRLGWLGGVRYSTFSTLSCFSRIEGWRALEDKWRNERLWWQTADLLGGWSPKRASLPLNGEALCVLSAT